MSHRAQPPPNVCQDLQVNHECDRGQRSAGHFRAGSLRRTHQRTFCTRHSQFSLGHGGFFFFQSTFKPIQGFPRVKQWVCSKNRIQTQQSKSHNLKLNVFLSAKTMSEILLVLTNLTYRLESTCRCLTLQYLNESILTNCLFWTEDCVPRVIKELLTFGSHHYTV